MVGEDRSNLYAFKLDVALRLHAETIRDIWVGEPGVTATLTFTQFLSFDAEQVQCCFTSTETIRANRYRGTRDGPEL